MLDTHKLLYILPEVAYIVELLPAKKEHTFAIQTFRQINGEFLNDNEFIPENIEKLISKLDRETYHLILPDFLFTNTIVEVGETNEGKVKEYLKEKLLPSLDLSTSSHELKTFVLTQHGGKTKVQLSALEKSLMNPVSTSCKDHQITVSSVSPLSWTVKSVVSLEPSITIVQMSSHLYLAEHYIGVDQANQSTVDEVETLGETIKTLKGAEPSIQTVYLLTNSLIEDKLKEQLSGILPLQQLASFKEEDSDMPSYVKQIIESGMKTLSIPDFPVPQFPLSEPTGEVQPVFSSSEDDDADNDEIKALPAESASNLELEETTPKPLELDDEVHKIAELPTGDNTSDLPKPDKVDAATPEAISSAIPTTVAASVTELDLSSDDNISGPLELTPVENVTESKPDVASTQTDAASSPAGTSSTETQSVPESATMTTTATKTSTTTPEPSHRSLAPESTTSRPETSSSNQDFTGVIKNQSGVQPMLKMILISVVVFLITVAVGVGLGLGFMKLSQQSSSTSGASSSPSPAPTEEPSPTPSPSPAADVDVSELSVLVVNATTKAGYAGTTKSALEKAEFGTVKAGNAKGEYDEGTFVLMKEENTALVDKLEKTLDVTLEFSNEISVEDPESKYDAVIVLAK